MQRRKGVTDRQRARDGGEKTESERGGGSES